MAGWGGVGWGGGVGGRSPYRDKTPRSQPAELAWGVGSARAAKWRCVHARITSFGCSIAESHVEAAAGPSKKRRQRARAQQGQFVCWRVGLEVIARGLDWNKAPPPLEQGL
jgi:hypothetical protein